jgi:hypothetical protein
VHLADLHDLDGVDITRRAQHDELHLAVAFALRSLVGLDGVLHGEAV